ncbi:hypothetical protein A4G20_00110 [Pasteurellaceae bacterium RH1A]|nr:hypothetical protein A4G20_00110 [Pasteurellaceae bacterium RH1A]
MRKTFFLSSLFLLFSTSALATWQKINDVDYTFGPFKIYNISLYTETGEYNPGIRPLMLTLKYEKPVDGRDFAISLARSWSNLGIKVEDQENIISHLRKTLPNIDPKDSLSYIALEDRGYFVLNDTVLSDEFSEEVNNAIVSVWLDPRVEIGKKITLKRKDEAERETVTVPIAGVREPVPEQAVENQENSAKEENKVDEPAPAADNQPEEAKPESVQPTQPEEKTEPQPQAEPDAPEPAAPAEDEGAEPIIDPSIKPKLPIS